MSQQINLFNPAFRKRRITLSAARVALLCGLSLIGMMGLWFYEHQVIAGLRVELATAQNLLKAQRSHVERIAQARAARRKDNFLDKEIARLESQLQQARQQLETLQGGVSGEGQGFSEYLRAFSRQSIDGLWLTGFDIRADGEITIRGRTVSPRLVPDYIQRLDREDVLRGRTFAAFNMERPSADRPAAAGKPEAVGSSRFLEFRLATAEPKAAPAGPGERVQ